MSIEAFVQRLERSGRTRASVSAVHRIAPRAAQTAPYPDYVPACLRDALERSGVSAPYAHQA